MIYYFSGTGNTEHIAKKLAAETGQELILITHETIIDKDENTIILTPLYFWSMPQIVKEYLSKTTWEKDDELIFIVTCGGFLGTGDLAIEKLVNPARSKVYELPMETNYIILHEIDDEETIKRKLKKADESLLAIIDDFEVGNLTYSSKKWLKVGIFITKEMYNHYRKTKNFRVSDACISCGLCVKNCPDSTIEISNQGKPTWVKERCQNCLRCLHMCPKEAIDYGVKTQGKKRYTYKKYSDIWGYAMVEKQSNVLGL